MTGRLNRFKRYGGDWGQRVPMVDCIKGRLYHIGCRNMDYGVYDGKEGFIGIREKFGHEFLFTEYHFDQGAPFGTVHTVIDTEIDIPEGIELKTLVHNDDKKTFSTYQPLFEWLQKHETVEEAQNGLQENT